MCVCVWLYLALTHCYSIGFTSHPRQHLIELNVRRRMTEALRGPAVDKMKHTIWLETPKWLMHVFLFKINLSTFGILESWKVGGWNFNSVPWAEQGTVKSNTGRQWATDRWTVWGLNTQRHPPINWTELTTFLIIQRSLFTFKSSAVRLKPGS